MGLKGKEIIKEKPRTTFVRGFLMFKYIILNLRRSLLCQKKSCNAIRSFAPLKMINEGRYFPSCFSFCTFSGFICGKNSTS